MAVAGVVFDTGSLEPLFGAAVRDTLTGVGTATDRYGRFSLDVPLKGRRAIALTVSYLGYEPRTIMISMPTDTLLRIGLSLMPLEAGEVEVTVQREAFGATPGSVIRLTPEEVKQMPALAGEADLVKVLQLMPGVQGGQEGSSGLYVRGGSPDQNLVLLDGTPVYNANHLLGFLSTFSTNALRAVELTKGAGSARHGGRLASVLDVSLKEGNRLERQTAVSVGLVASQVTTEGPIRKGKSSYLVSARRTYLDALARLFQTPDERYGYYFYDLVVKASHVGARSGLYASLYAGQDRFWQESRETFSHTVETYDGGLGWGNLTGTLRYQQLITPRLALSTSVGLTRYRLAFAERDREEYAAEPGTSETTTAEATYTTSVADVLARLDFDHTLAAGHMLRYGLGVTRHTFTPSRAVTTISGDGIEAERTETGAARETGTHATLYAEDAFGHGKWSVSAGMRANLFVTGNRRYMGIEPRLAVRYALYSHTWFDASLGYGTQYVHLISRTGVGLPLDVWLPATDRVRPQRGRQIALSVSRDVASGVVLSAEVFHKMMEGLIMPLGGVSLAGVDAARWEERVVVGRGRARGLELLVRRRTGRLSGHAAYTLSKSTRQFRGIDGGMPFPYRYDRRHDAALALAYEASRTWTLSLVWVYATGDALWLPEARMPGLEDDAGFAYRPVNVQVDAFVFGRRGSVRAPSYHRLDVSAQHMRTLQSGRRQRWVIGLYNIYARQNPFFIYPRVAGDGRLTYRQVSPFVLVPSLRYETTF